MKKIDAYRAMLDAIERCAEEIHIDSTVDIRAKLKVLIKAEELSAAFGITVPLQSYSSDWFRISEYQMIALYGIGHNTIYRADDGANPENEWLYVLSFDRGPYTFGKKHQITTIHQTFLNEFGNEYPAASFQSFFNEMKTWGPKYVDTANKKLYFTSEKSAAVHNAFPEIFQRAKKQAEAEIQQKKIKALQDELKRLHLPTAPVA